MYQRTTTASRRRDRMMNTNWLHVSQWLKPTKIKSAEYVMAQAGVL